MEKEVNEFKIEDTFVKPSEFKVGDTFTYPAGTTVTSLLADKKVELQRESEVIIGGDNLAHLWRWNVPLPLDENIKVSGYNAPLLAAYLFKYLQSTFQIRGILENNEITESKFTAEIVRALERIGLC